MPASYHTGFAPRDGYPAYPELWRGCVAAWAPCLGPTGLTLRDWSGRQSHATLTNATTNAAWSVLSGRYAITLDGMDDFLQTSYNLPATADFSFSGSFRTNQSSEGNLFSNNNAQAGRCDIKATSLNGSIYTPLLFINGSPSLLLYGTSQSNTNQWRSITVTRRGTLFSMWLDGIRESTATSSNAIDQTLPFRIGSHAAPGGFQFLAGSFDSIMIHNRCISDQEIRLLHSRRGIAYEMYGPAYYMPPISARRRKILTGQV